MKKKNEMMKSFSSKGNIGMTESAVRLEIISFSLADYSVLTLISYFLFTNVSNKIRIIQFSAVIPQYYHRHHVVVHIRFSGMNE